VPILLLAFLLSAFFAPFVFLGGFGLALVGMMLWGLGMGAQDSVLKAALADVIPPEKRSTAFGVFDAGFGIAWFTGSAWERCTTRPFSHWSSSPSCSSSEHCRSCSWQGDVAREMLTVR
jgi:MFS family permease